MPLGTRVTRPFAITIGEGRTNPQGKYIPCTPAVDEIAELLRKQPATVERWWSMHLWEKNRRKAIAWQASTGVVIDIDYKIPKENPPEGLVNRLRHAAAAGDLPGCLFHLTPHGARLAWVYEEACTDRELQKKAERGAGTLAAVALERLELTDYQVDSGLLGELARYFYTPDSIAKGVKRSAEVFVMRTDLVKPVDLAVHDVKVRPIEIPKTAEPIPVSDDLAAAIDQWNNDHPGNWPRHSEECPVCHDDASFGHLPDNETRWYCFSTDHANVGVKGDKGYHGDALDLEAHRRGCKPIDVLRKDGYLVKRKPPIEPSDDRDAPSPTDEGQIFRPYRSRSYLTAVDILRRNDPRRNILENRKLEFNDMSGGVELGRVPIKDSDVHRIRARIEERFTGGVDKNNNEVGLQLSSSDVFAAVEQVANEHPYHPVRDYLNKLKWDGTPRIAQVLKCLGAEDTRINHIILRRFFVSAVARPLQPGCKVDTILILVGKQGAFKSSFFRVLSDPWFIDTVIDIASDPVRAYMTMRKAWLLEWAELESLFRARTASAAKAFITSAVDSYVPKHARYSVEVKRSGVVVGTINPDEFLADDTGHRRFWPLTVAPEIDLTTIATIRDQLWAEAVAIYNGAQTCSECARIFDRCIEHRWWLSKEEEALLVPTHRQHEVSDAWAASILSFVSTKAVVAIQDILRDALDLPIGQWTDREVKRVCRVLRTSGEWKPDPNKVRGKPRYWVKITEPGAEPGHENLSIPVPSPVPSSTQ